jgi:UDP-N-acetylglucosamine transferase subunit ALG13
VDEWAVMQKRTDIVAQVGPSAYRPQIVSAFAFLAPDAFRELQTASTILISHAGMGSILTAMECGKPIIIMPRDHLRGEHRNGHQIATAERFRDTPGVYVAMNEDDLAAHLARLSDLHASSRVSPYAPESFTSRLRDFIDGQ